MIDLVAETYRWRLGCLFGGPAKGRRSRQVDLNEVSAAVAAPVPVAYVRKELVTRPFLDARVGDPVSALEAEADRHSVFVVTNAQVNGGAEAWVTPRFGDRKCPV
jgi:hypothetical protein